MKNTLSLLLFCMFFLLSSCKNTDSRTTNISETQKALETKDKVIIQRTSQKYNDYKWDLIKYSDNTYGAEVNNNIILTDCKNEIYIGGYNNDYVFMTKKEDDWYFYNLSGEFLFKIKNQKWVMVMYYLSSSNGIQNSTLKNGYIYAEDSDGKKSVFSLDGKMIIAPVECYSISAIMVEIDKEEWAIWGYEVSLKNRLDKIYDFKGNYILSGKSIVQQNNGACPIFQVEESNSYWLYNYKGRRIVNIYDYFECDVHNENCGFSYIVCETEEGHNKYYGNSAKVWISINGDILKEEGSSLVNNSMMSDDRNEFYQAKSIIVNHKNSMPKFNKTKSTTKLSVQPTNTEYSNQRSVSGMNNSYIEGYNNNIKYEDNSRWESHYNDIYNRYANNVQSHISTLNTLISTKNSSATSSYAISELKSNIRNAQNDMKRVRNEALQHGVKISASYLEDVSF